MNLYLIEQDSRDGIDNYDAAVVVARSEDEARGIHPSGDQGQWKAERCWSGWAEKPENVKVILLGTACDRFTEPDVVLASLIEG